MLKRPMAITDRPLMLPPQRVSPLLLLLAFRAHDAAAAIATLFRLFHCRHDAA